MEFADNGDLYQKIVQHKKKAIFFEESDVWRIFIQLVKGLKALHDLKILHRDLKSANVFLESNGCAKLGDLNVSKVAKKGLGYTQTGTPYYASPEVWKDNPYNLKSDIWSLGCVLYEMITLKPPFRAENMEGLYNKVIKGQFSRIPDRFSDDLMKILTRLLQVQPENRPTCDEILKNALVQKRIEYFKSFTNDDVNEDQALLQTIRIPKNLLFLSDKLPKPNYEKTPKQKNYRSFSNNRDLENMSKEKGERPKMLPQGSKREVYKNSLSPTPVYTNNRNGEFPQLEIVSSRKRVERSPVQVSNKRIIKNSQRSNEHLKDLYKLYAPYINNPIRKYNKNSERIRNPNINYVRNIERYYDNYNMKNNNNKYESVESKVIPRRRLNPIKRNVIKI